MKKFNIFLIVALITCLLAAPASSMEFNLLDATPIGSWQEREDITTDHRGRSTATIMRSSLLAKEQRDGEMFYWIEMAAESFKINKKGKRKKDGDKVILKSLVSESALTGDPANLLSNLRGFGKELIIQSGNEQPMRISQGGGLMSGLMAATGTEVNHSFEDQGEEMVTVPAGEFKALKIVGSGVAETKVVFKKIRVESTSTAWMSEKVPFGLIKSEGTSKMNGKDSTHSSQLLAFGLDGAESQIQGEPQEMPGLGNIFGN